MRNAYFLRKTVKMARGRNPQRHRKASKLVGQCLQRTLPCELDDPPKWCQRYF